MITLTVTDNAGATGTTTRAADPTGPVNQPPTAVAGGSCTLLGCSVTASGSADPDGSIQSYSWHWGDGTPDGSGATSNHLYAAAGTFSVTDNQGATATAPVQLTTTAPSNMPFAADTFARTLASGWGTATTGGAWTVSGPAANYAVSGGVGSMTAKAGGTDAALLSAVSSRDTDLEVTVSTDKIANSNGTYITLIGRRAGTNLEYEARLRARSDGSVAMMLSSLNGTATTTTLEPEVAPTGLTLTGGAGVTARFQATGTSPTTLRVRAWMAGSAEPSGWQLTTTDSFAALQAAGWVGLQSYVSSTSTVTPVTLRVSDLSARPVVGN